MYNQNSGYGQALLNAVAQQVPTFGRIFIVMDPDDTSMQHYDMMKELFPQDPQGNVRLFTDLAAAYAAAESNNNDVILLDANSTHVLTAVLTITKNRVHFMGMDGGERLVQQGAKVQLGGAIDAAYVVKDNGVRNSFRNIKFIMASTHANAKSVLQLGSEGGLYKNISAVFGVVNNLGATDTFEVINGADSGTFINCTFGADTLLTSAARAVMSIDQVNGFEFKSNIFKSCNFIISSSSSTAAFIRLSAVGDILFSNLFDRCNFVASVDSAGGAALAEAVQTGTGTVKGTLNFVSPGTFAVTNFTTATSGRNAAVYVIGPVLTPEAKTDLVAQIPVAT